ncbi:MAG TPA: glycosyltransferase family 2 protein [Methanomassiliicoccales archaeon]|nr:glycosyltransferase family 2 protein [Methanomassiliicoccales archaeon]
MLPPLDIVGFEEGVKKEYSHHMAMVLSGRVFAITVNWNRADDTMECLDSLVKSGVDQSSIIVVDNGSTDGSVELISKRMSSVQIMKMGENLGYIKGVNRGISRALDNGAQMILLINNDATVDPDAIDKLLEAAASRKEAGILGPKILYYGRSVIWFAGGRFNWRWGFSSHPGMDEADISEVEDEKVDFITGCVMLVRREVFEEVGLFDESYWMYAEDLDFCLKALFKGWESWVIPSAVAHHKVSASSGVKGSNVMTRMRSYYYAKNMFVLVKKLPRSEGSFTRLLGQFLVRFPYYTVLISIQGVKGGLISYLRGMIDGLRMILRGGATTD